MSENSHLSTGLLKGKLFISLYLFSCRQNEVKTYIPNIDLTCCMFMIEEKGTKGYDSLFNKEQFIQGLNTKRIASIIK